ARGTARSGCDNQTGEGTSPQRSSPTVSVGYAYALRLRPRGLQEAPSHRGPAEGPQQRVAPDGGLAPCAPVLGGGGAGGLWRVFRRLVYGGTWCTPGFRGDRSRLQSVQAHVL